MSHVFRFFGSRAADGTWTVSNDDITHITRVLRLESGAEIEIADGQGHACRAELQRIGKDKISTITKEEWQADPPKFKVGLAVGALKPAAMDELLPQVVELGVDAVVFFGQRNVAKFRVGDEQVERWNRVARASAKQCKRLWLPEIISMPDLESTLKHFAGWRGYILDPNAKQHLLDDVASAINEVAIVGGEKGLDEIEVRLALEAGYTPVAIGDHVLRAVTAASVATFSLGRRRALCETRRHS